MKQLSPEEIAARKRYAEAKSRLEEAKKRQDEAFKKVVKDSTPKVREQMVDGIMERRDGDYQALFASWDIDSKIIDEALVIVRRRELRMIEDRTVYFQNSLSLRIAKAYGINKDVENSLAQLELTNLLGASRSAELLAAEERMREAEYARAGIRMPKDN